MYGLHILFSTVAIAGLSSHRPLVTFNKTDPGSRFVDAGLEAGEVLFQSVEVHRRELGLRGNILSVECDVQGIEGEVFDNMIMLTSYFPDKESGLCTVRSKKGTAQIRYVHRIDVIPDSCFL